MDRENARACPFFLCSSAFVGAGLEKMGMQLEDFQPSTNSMGTDMGNLTRIMEVCLMRGVFMRVRGLKQ